MNCLTFSRAVIGRVVPSLWFAAAVLLLFPAAVQADEPAYWKWAATPPMGWNSYDAWGSSVTETEVLSNAGYLREHLLAHGWKYVVIDFRWYDVVSPYDDRAITRERTGAKLFADEFGRMLPATNRFPSAIGGGGFKPLADQIHAMGLKFGFHMMRGIPRQAVKAGTPIEGGAFTAADAGDTNSVCGWCPDMFGVRDNEAGQAWYDSCARLWASWGLDFVKVDDLSNPYHTPEIEMIRKALDRCGRPVVFSTSAGPTPIAQAAHISTHANQWRISGDFWDRWADLYRAFNLLDRWQNDGGPGHWPDADMIPFGHIGIKCTIAGTDRQTRFSKDEQITLMSLWAIAQSPLMLGANLPDNDAWTLSLLTNDEVLAVDQNSTHHRPLFSTNNEVAWVADIPESGDKYVALFNTSPAPVLNRRGGGSATTTNAPSADATQPRTISVSLADLGFSGRVAVRDLWNHKDLGPASGAFAQQINSHGAGLYRIHPEN